MKGHYWGVSLLIWLFLLSAPSYGEEKAHALSLDECVRWALKFNPEIRAADFSIAEAMEKKVDAQRLGHPVVEYEYNLAPVPQDVSNAVSSLFSGDVTVFNRVKVGLGIPVYTFGKVKTGKALAQRGIEAEQEQKIKKQAEVVFKVKQLYYGIQLSHEVGELVQSAQKQVQDQVKKKAAQETHDPAELLKLKLFGMELAKRADEVKQRGILALEGLRVLLGLESGVGFNIASHQLSPINRRLGSFASYQLLTEQDRSDLKLLQIGYEAKAQELKLEKRLMTPNVGVGGFFEVGSAPFIKGVTTTDDFSDPFNFTRAGFGIRLNGTFDYHHSFSRLRSLESQLYKTGLMKTHAEHGINLELKEAYLQLQSAKEAVNRADEAGKLSRQLLFLTQSNLDIGLGEAKDLIDATTAFLQTRGAYFEATFNYNAAWAKLDEKTGWVPAQSGGNDEK